MLDGRQMKLRGERNEKMTDLKSTLVNPTKTENVLACTYNMEVR